MERKRHRMSTYMIFSYTTVRSTNASTMGFCGGTEFVEKYVSYELILYLKPEVKRRIEKTGD